MFEWLRIHPLDLVGGIVIFSIIGSLLAIAILRTVYPKEEKKIAIFFFVVGLVMPFVGLIATTLLSILLKIRHLRQQNMDMENIDLEPLYISFTRTKRIFGEGAMKVVLQNDKVPVALKIKALTSLQKEPNRYRLNLIKLALIDRQDEVRLFSFSIIDRFEKRLNSKIHQSLEKYETAKSKEQKVLSAKALANLYWDMVYFELADPVLQNFFIKEAKRFTEYVLQNHIGDLSMHILAGKIALKEKDLQRAQREFALVLESDTRRYDFIAPYLAEIFYQQDNFITTKSLIVNSHHLRYNQQLYPLVALWTDRI